MEAHNVLSATYGRAVRILKEEDTESLQLRVASENLEAQMIPLLESLSSTVGDRDWAERSVCCLGLLLAQLEKAATAITTQCAMLLYSECEIQ